MRRRVAKKISRFLLERTIERVTADLPIFPARGWPWRGRYRLGTINKVNRITIRDLSRFFFKTQQPPPEKRS